MDDTFSTVLKMIRDLHFEIDLLSQTLRLCAVSMIHGLEDTVSQGHVYEILGFCEQSIRHLEMSRSSRPILLNFLTKREGEHDIMLKIFAGRLLTS